MRIFLHDLKEKTSLDFTYDYQEAIQSIVDMISIEPAKIHIDIKDHDNGYVLKMTLNVDMKLACSKTMKPVDYHMEVKEDVILDDGDEADFSLTDPIELSDI